MHNIIRIYFFRKEKIQFQIEFILSMDYLKILGLSSLSIFVLFILTKLMGNREMTQLSMFDYAVSITIGSIAAEMATALETDFMQPLIAMVVYAIITIIISYIANKSLVARRIINGNSVILFNNGKLYRENLKKAKLDLSEFLTQCRNQGYFNIADVETIVLESNGRLSMLPKASKRPATPEDLGISVESEKIISTIILDGEVLKDNLEHIGKNEEWLFKEMKKQGYPNEHSIFLATVDKDLNLSIYDKISIKSERDKFQ